MRVIYEILLQLLVHPLLQFFFNDLLSNYLHVVSHFILSGNQLDGSNFWLMRRSLWLITPVCPFDDNLMDRKSKSGDYNCLSCTERFLAPAMIDLNNAAFVKSLIITCYDSNILYCTQLDFNIARLSLFVTLTL